MAHTLGLGQPTPLRTPVGTDHHTVYDQNDQACPIHRALPTNRHRTRRHSLSCHALAPHVLRQRRSNTFAAMATASEYTLKHRAIMSAVAAVRNIQACSGDLLESQTGRWEHTDEHYAGVASGD